MFIDSAVQFNNHFLEMFDQDPTFRVSEMKQMAKTAIMYDIETRQMTSKPRRFTLVVVQREDDPVGPDPLSFQFGFNVCGLVTLLYDTKCIVCKREGAEVKVCNQCHIARYCSKECQKADWKCHKKMCRKVKSSR